MPAVVVVGVRYVPLYVQFETPSAVDAALRMPFVTLRLVPVISVITSFPILNEVAARFVVVAFVMVALVPRRDAMVPALALKIDAKRFVDDAAVVVPAVAVKVFKYALFATVSAVVDA
jgi:hypothetical protein